MRAALARHAIATNVTNAFLSPQLFCGASTRSSQRGANLCSSTGAVHKAAREDEVMFEEFEKDKQQKGRGRFGVSLATSALLCTGVFGGLVAASAAARSSVQEEDLVQLEFALPEET